jgi:hypothetical protein
VAPTTEELHQVAREKGIDPEGKTDEELIELLTDPEAPDDDGEPADEAQPGTDGLTPIPVDPAARPEAPTAAAPTPAHQPGVGRTANVTDSALPSSLAERNARIREEGQQASSDDD